MAQEDTKNVIEALRASGYIIYGAEIPGETLREAFDIHYPDEGSLADFTYLMDLEKFAYLSVKGILLSEGKCFVKARSNYRILNLSEHEDKAQGYMDEARGKMNKAQQLAELITPVDQTEAIRVANMLALIEFRKNSLDGRKHWERPGKK